MSNKNTVIGENGIYDARTLGTPKMILLGLQHMFLVLSAHSFPIRTIPSVREFHPFGSKRSSQTLLPVGNYTPPQRISVILFFYSIPFFTRTVKQIAIQAENPPKKYSPCPFRYPHRMQTRAAAIPFSQSKAPSPCLLRGVYA